MSSSRVYAAASGRCLIRGPDGIDETERDLVQRDFHAGVRLAVDPDRGEIRGVVPARRRSEELFYAVVRPDADEPLAVATFHAAVAEVFDRRDRWAIRTDTPEGEPFRRFLDGAADRGTDGGAATPAPSADLDAVVDRVATRLRERTPTDPPVVVGVDAFGDGLALLDGLREAGLDPGSAGGAVIARTARAQHLDPALVVRIRDGEDGVAILDRGADVDRGAGGDPGTGGDPSPGGDPGAGSEAEFDDSEKGKADPTVRPNGEGWSSTGRRVVAGAGVLGGALVAAGGVGRGAPALAALGLGVAVATLLLARR